MRSWKLSSCNGVPLPRLPQDLRRHRGRGARVPEEHDRGSSQTPEAIRRRRPQQVSRLQIHWLVLLFFFFFLRSANVVFKSVPESRMSASLPEGQTKPRQSGVACSYL